MVRDAPPFAVVDGSKTLPLYVLAAKCAEDIPPFSSGKVSIQHREPRYEIPEVRVDSETLDRLGADAEFARELVASWREHNSDFSYFVQFSDDQATTRCEALHNHTQLISILCDSRLGIDPTTLWRCFDASITFHSIHSSYRKDPEGDSNWELHAAKLAEAHHRSDEDILDGVRLQARILTQIELKSRGWGRLPAIHTSQKRVSLGEFDLFYSYSHADKSLRDLLDNHLSALRRQGVIRAWHDRQISPGSEWSGQVDQYLESAHIVLLLISADFLASDYCYDVEMQRAVARHESGTALVIPIILRACDWSDAPFGQIQALPRNGNAITSWPNIDEALTDVAKELRRAISELRKKGFPTCQN